MVRRVVLVVLSAVLVVAVSPIAFGHHRDGHAPPGQAKKVTGPCADGSAGWDITDGSGTYTPLVPGGLDFTVTVAAPSCPEVAFTFYVLDGENLDGSFSSDVLYTQRDVGNGSTSFVYDVTITDDDRSVCVYHEVRSLDGTQLFDRAPDTGCVSPGPGSRGYN